MSRSQTFQLVRSLLAASAAGLLSAAAPAPQASRALVDISEHRLTLYDGDAVLGRWKVGIGSGGKVAKCRDGDKRTPHGDYLLSPGRKSRYRTFLPISYPNREDRARGCTGSAIGIHGTGNQLKYKLGQTTGMDWSTGCITVTNKEIDRISELVRSRIPISITA
jgi:murein L,D-transpeptidase YafK